MEKKDALKVALSSMDLPQNGPERWKELRFLQLINDSEMYNTFSENLNNKVRKQFVSEKASEVWSEIIRKINYV